MKYDLNNNEHLITFLNNILERDDLTESAPLIIKFFIITRNYGLINFEDNINKIVNGYDFTDLCLESLSNEPDFNKDKLISLLINNYHDNGFYFHSFPGVYKKSIDELGLIADTRNNDDLKYAEIANKYHFGEYFIKDDKLSVTEKIANTYTMEYAIFAPEWLDMFLKQGNHDIHEAIRRNNASEIESIIENALNFFNYGMQRDPLYNENDYKFLCNYIRDEVNKRYTNGNDEVCIALIEKNKTDDYFKKHVQNNDIRDIKRYIDSNNIDNKQIFEFIIESLSNKKKETTRNIPRNLIRFISYNLKEINLDKETTK